MPQPGSSAINKLSITRVRTPEEVEAARILFTEYAGWLGLDLSFQNFDAELASLPGGYAPPQGELLLGYAGGELAGCVAVHEWDPESRVCEMKRLYLRDRFRGCGLGRLLAEEIMMRARQLGYARMRLDTIAGPMQAAMRLYGRLGFEIIAPYRNNPIPGATFMEIDLERNQAGETNPI